MFIDEARIFVKGGDGGNGTATFRREKHVPRGGPDGGNGGYGGNIIFEVDEGLKTLLDFKYKRQYEAPRGMRGQGSLKNGKSGPDLVLKVPPGTLIKDDAGNVLFDLTAKGQRFVAAAGGHGGKGNAYFASARYKAPSFAQKGEPAEERWLVLELKLLADVGIVGLPNAGKSTFISVVSAARPKIADYPFTTLVPNLGVVQADDFSYVVADIPGLIKGAHKGAGLGDVFLRHIDRAGLILHILDLSNANPLEDFEIVDNELSLYSEDLAKRPKLVVGNKIDILPEHELRIEKIRDYFAKREIPFFVISAATKKGLKPLLRFVGQKVQEIRESAFAKATADKEPVVTYGLSNQKLSDFEISKEAEGVFRVSGKAIERLVVMTDTENSEALHYLHNQFKAIRLDHRLHKAGAKDGDTVKISSFEFTFESDNTP